MKYPLPLVLFALLIAVRGQAQPGFSRLYALDVPSAGLHNIVAAGDTLYGLGTGYSDSTGQWGLLLATFDTLGEPLAVHTWYDSLGDDLVFENGYGLIETADGSLAATGNLWDRNWGFFIKMSKQGQLLRWHEYPDSGILNYRYKTLLECPDGYLIGGSKQLANYRTQVFLQKINTDGAVIWEKKYGDPTRSSYLGSMVAGADGSFIVGASEQSYPWSAPLQYNEDWIKSWLFAVDSLGNVLWEFKSASYEESRINALRQCADGGLLYTTWTTDFLNPLTQGSRPVAVRRDAARNLLWMLPLAGNTVPGNIVYDLEPGPDGHWLALGHWATPNGSVYGWPGACLYKFTDNGDSLWARCDTVADNQYSAEVLSGLAVLPSGSAIAAGKANYLTTTEQRSYGWLYKLDAAGCLQAPCATGGLGSTKAGPVGGLTIYPNPTDGSVSVALPETGVSFEVRCYDLWGRMVARQRGTGLVVTLDLGQQPSGIYWVLAAVDGRWMRQRLLRK